MIFGLTISITCDIDKFGTDSQKAEFLPGLCSMDITASYCLTEPGRWITDKCFYYFCCVTMIILLSFIITLILSITTISSLLFLTFPYSSFIVLTGSGSDASALITTATHDPATDEYARTVLTTLSVILSLSLSFIYCLFVYLFMHLLISLTHSNSLIHIFTLFHFLISLFNHV